MAPAHRHVALAALVVAGLATGGLALRHRPSPSAVEGEPLPVRRAPTVMPAAPRLAWRPVAGDLPVDVDDFTLAGDTVVALDRRGARVLLLRPAGDRWAPVGGWGRAGGGPGEFERPVALARTAAGEVAVLEESGRLQRFDPAGRLVGSERVPLPCVARTARLAFGPGAARWLAASCGGTGRSRDTIFTALFRAEGAGAYAEVRRLPRMATDLSWGSVLGTRHPLADDGDVVWFGTFQDGCAWRLAGSAAGATTAPARRCALVRERLASPPPPDLDRQRREAERRGQRQVARLLRWPPTLPPFVALLRDGERLLLARPLGPDSLAIVPAGAPFDAARARLVAPLASFVTCARGGCLWYDGDGRLALWRPDAAPDVPPHGAPDGPPTRAVALRRDAR